MSYFAGVGPRLASVLTDVTHPGPCAVCDGCRKVASGTTTKGHAAAWLRNGSPPKGWKMVRTLDDEGDLIRREDYCQSCKLHL